MTLNNQVTTKWRVFFWGLLALVFALSHRYQADPTGESVFAPDKMLHFAAFGAITFLFIGSRYISNGLIVFAVATTWVIFDEWTQHLFPNNRTWSTEDVVSSELGVIAAVCWKGACSSRKLQPLKESFDAILNSWHMWVMLSVVGFTTLCVGVLTLWHFMHLFIEVPSDSFVMILSLSVSALMMLLYLMRDDTIHAILSPLLKSMVIPLMGSIGLSPFIALIFSFFTTIPLVIAFTFIVSSARLIWDTKVFTLRELSVDH